MANLNFYLVGANIISVLHYHTHFSFEIKSTFSFKKKVVLMLKVFIIIYFCLRYDVLK